MEDSAIIDLYWARQETALTETEKKYGGYCRTIARNILHDEQDSEETVSDTWLHAWNAMPPQRPGVLCAFLGRITRNLSLDRFRASRAEKRGGGSLPLALEELEECIPSELRTESRLEEGELVALIDGYLRRLSRRDCTVFLRRYWYMDSVRRIASRLELPENTVKSILHRTREGLRKELRREGVSI